MVHLPREATIPNPSTAAVLTKDGEQLHESIHKPTKPKKKQYNKKKKRLRQTRLTQHSPEINQELLQMWGSKSTKKESNTLRVVMQMASPTKMNML